MTHQAPRPYRHDDPDPLTAGPDALRAAHLDLVDGLVSELTREAPSHVDRSAVRSAGLTALLRAARTFDDGLGVPFVRFASACILRSVLAELDGLDQVVVDPAAHAAREEQRALLVDAIAVLPDRLRLVIEDYFLAERPVPEIATRLGLTVAQVARLRTEALELLRDALNGALDPSLVPDVVRPDPVVVRRHRSYFEAVAERHSASRRSWTSVSSIGSATAPV